MIRAARKEDIPGILEIYNDAILHTTAVYDYEAHTLAMREAWFEAKQSEGFPVLVWEDVGGRVAGFASFGPFRAWAAYRYTVEHSVYVHRDCRGRGLGLALLRAIIAAAEEGGFAVMVAGIDASNEASIRLHEKLGFEPAGTIRRAGYKFDRWLDLTFYQRMLEGPQLPITT
ncbi:GNAT family N-acetyltransferase [Paenibacillus sp. TRM 82003]|nr:GNAT family N-acetyltransferase [Paenibacillus sp. TRM 82003]